MNKNNNIKTTDRVIAISAGKTIDLIYQTSIHAHPNNLKSYPYTNKKYDYYAFFNSNAAIEKIYIPYKTIVFNPFSTESLTNLNLTDNEIIRLEKYIDMRKNLPNKSKKFQIEKDSIDYKFYFFYEPLKLPNPIIKHNIQRFTYFTMYSLFNSKGETKNINDLEDEGIKLNNETLDTLETYIEGDSIKVAVNKYERNKLAKEKCLKYHGYSCAICGFNFENFYGNIGKNIIEVHHKIPLYMIRKSYEVNPIKDLIPVCPNCHRVIHSKKPAYQIEVLRFLLKHGILK